MEIAFVFVWSTVLFFLASAYTRTQYERATDERVKSMKEQREDFGRSLTIFNESLITRTRQIESMLENLDDIKKFAKQKGDAAPGFYGGRIYINGETYDIFELVKNIEFCQQKCSKKGSKK